MNVKRILFNYIVENEGYTDMPELEEIENELINTFSNEQIELFEKYNNVYSKYNSDRLYYYFCKGIEAKL